MTTQKEYEFRVVEPGIRWKVTHNIKDGGPTTRAVYFVRYHPRTDQLTCTCPGFRRYRRCKHARFTANLIGRPELAAEGGGK